MSSIVVINNVTLDGVMQAPGGPEEDTRDGFDHRGWAVPYEAMGSLMGEQIPRTEALLFGRRTYEQFYAFWLGQAGNPFTEVLTKIGKYVASRTLAEPLPWANSTLLGGDAADGVAGLRARGGGDIVVLGSGQLVRSLAHRGQVDRYILLIHPLVLGAGRRLFESGDALAKFSLARSRTTPAGVVIATYDAEDVATRSGR